MTNLYIKGHMFERNIHETCVTSGLFSGDGLSIVSHSKCNARYLSPLFITLFFLGGGAFIFCLVFFSVFPLFPLYPLFPMYPFSQIDTLTWSKLSVSYFFVWLVLDSLPKHISLLHCTTVAEKMMAGKNRTQSTEGRGCSQILLSSTGHEDSMRWSKADMTVARS